MSVRAKRQQLGSFLSARLKQIEQRREADKTEEAALNEALKALSEMPRLSEPSSYTLEYIPIHPATIEQGNCGACGQSSVGWSEKWRFCPVCGNSITVSRESMDGQNKRTALNAVREAIGA